MAEFEFNDSIQHNLDILGEIASQMPRGASVRARNAGAAVEQHVIDLLRSAGKDPAVRLGVTLSLHMLAQHLVQKSNEEGTDSLIQLA